MRKAIGLLALCFGSAAIAADIDLNNVDSFNPRCSYRVHLSENGITSQAVMISKHKIIFETVVDINKFTDLEYEDLREQRLEIYSKNKSIALTNGTESTQEYLGAGEYKVNLVNGSYITEHSCSKK